MVGLIAVLLGEVPVLTPDVPPTVPVLEVGDVAAGLAPIGWAALPEEAFRPVVEVVPVVAEAAPVSMLFVVVPGVVAPVVPEVWEPVPEESDPPAAPVVAPCNTPALPAVVPAELLDPAVWEAATPSESTKIDGTIQNFFIL